MVTRYWKSGERSRSITEAITDRGSVEEYKAIQNDTQSIVILKRITKEGSAKEEWERLKGCNSEYILHYYDLLNGGKEQWVQTPADHHSLGSNGAR